MDENKTQSVINHAWFEKFSCIGGKCPMTCCMAKKWNITLKDNEVELYRGIDSDFGEELRGAIDFEKKKMKCKEAVFGESSGENGFKCALLTDDGWCKIVLTLGDEYLSDTCSTYPRSIAALNNHFWQHVDLSCPVVAEYLFDEEPVINNYIENIPFITETRHIEDNVFNALRDTQFFLMDLFLSVEGFDAGKCYIMFDISNSLANCFSQDDISPESLAGVINKYANADIIEGILTECEKFNENWAAKTEMAKMAIRLLEGLLSDIYKIMPERVPDILEHVKKWKSGDGIRDDFEEFYRFRDCQFPHFIQKNVSFRIFTYWLTHDYKNFSKKIKAGYCMVMFEQIVAMSAWKSNGRHLSVEDYACIISEMERNMSHSPENSEKFARNTEEIEGELNFSLFLLPVY